MSIKYKMPLFIILGFMLFLLILLAYFRFYLNEGLSEALSDFWQQYEMTNKRIVQQMMGYYPDQKKMKDYLQQIYERDNIQIKVINTSGNSIMATDGRNNNLPLLRQKEPAFYNNKLIYIVEFSYSFPLRSFRWGGSIGRLRITGILLIIIIILSIIVYLHYFIIKPLLVLQKGLDELSYNDLNVKLPSPKRRDEIGYLYHKFYEMTVRLRRTKKEQMDIISSISHDLKTPLTSIIGFSERLLSSKHQSVDRQQEYYKIIYHKAQDMSVLLEEFHKYAISELQDIELTKSKIELRPFMMELSRKYLRELNGDQGELVLEYQLEDGEFIIADRDKLKRVFANLISNSIKYSKGKLQIKIICSREGQYIKFALEDKGEGVPVEELEKIFDQFYRVDKSRSRYEGGSGLGLSICRNIIKDHGGKIWAYRPPDGGLGVSFLLPAG